MYLKTDNNGLINQTCPLRPRNIMNTILTKYCYKTVQVAIPGRSENFGYS